MAAQGTRGLRPQLLCTGALSSSCLAARRSGTGFCTPCAPGQYWSKLGTQQLMEAPTPQTWCPEQELLQAGAGTNLEGSQRRTREDAVTWLSCSPFRNGPGGGSVLRRQRGQCEVLTWLQALSSQVRVQPTGSTSPGARRAAFKVCVCGARVAALPWGCSTAPLISPPVLPGHQLHAPPASPAGDALGKESPRLLLAHLASP